MIDLFKVHMPETVLEPVRETLLSGYIGQGPKVELFEKALTKVVGTQHCLTVNTCTSAIRLALRLAGVEPGSEVIASPMTCLASNSPILEQYADIVWADIDPWTGNIDPLDVERKITAKTKAVIAVHWGGHPCDLRELTGVCRKYGIPLVEDAAHAIGASYQGRTVGAMSDFCTFSFQAIKHISTIEGGLLTCRSVDKYREGKLLRWYGIDRDTPRTDMRCEEDVRSVGMKYNFNDVGAAIGIEQLKYLPGILDRHRANASFFDGRLSGLRKVQRLRYKTDRVSSYWLYTIRVDDRGAFQEFMAQAGVMVSRVHVRNDIHSALGRFRKNLPGVDEFDRHQVSIPVGWWVTEEDREKIAKAVEEWSTR